MTGVEKGAQRGRQGERDSARVACCASGRCAAAPRAWLELQCAPCGCSPSLLQDDPGGAGGTAPLALSSSAAAAWAAAPEKPHRVGMCPRTAAGCLLLRPAALPRRAEADAQAGGGEGALPAGLAGYAAGVQAALALPRAYRLATRQATCSTCILRQAPLLQSQPRRGLKDRLTMSVASTVNAGWPAQALQAVADLASDPALHLEWDLEPGDIQARSPCLLLHCLPPACMLRLGQVAGGGSAGAAALRYACSRPDCLVAPPCLLRKSCCTTGPSCTCAPPLRTTPSCSAAATCCACTSATRPRGRWTRRGTAAIHRGSAWACMLLARYTRRPWRRSERECAAPV